MKDYPIPSLLSLAAPVLAVALLAVMPLQPQPAGPNADPYADDLFRLADTTVFAPTDAAFAKLPEGTVESLLEPENRDKLVEILTYHVVPGRVTASDVVGLDEAATVEGSMLNIKVDGSTVMINDATVTKTDLAASNGVVHVIDSVLMPPSDHSHGSGHSYSARHEDCSRSARHARKPSGCNRRRESSTPFPEAPGALLVAFPLHSHPETTSWST